MTPEDDSITASGFSADDIRADAMGRLRGATKQIIARLPRVVPLTGDEADHDPEYDLLLVMAMLKQEKASRRPRKGVINACTSHIICLSDYSEKA